MNGRRNKKKRMSGGNNETKSSNVHRTCIYIISNEIAPKMMNVLEFTEWKNGDIYSLYILFWRHFHWLTKVEKGSRIPRRTFLMSIHSFHSFSKRRNDICLWVDKVFGARRWTAPRIRRRSQKCRQHKLTTQRSRKGTRAREKRRIRRRTKLILYKFMYFYGILCVSC